MSRPEKVFTMFPVEVAIFKGTSGIYSATGTKSYKNKEGQWVRGTSFNGNEALAMSFLMRQAAEWIAQKESERQDEFRTRNKNEPVTTQNWNPDSYEDTPF